LGLVSVAAILCVSGIARIYAQTAPTEDQAPAAPQQSSTTPKQDTAPPRSTDSGTRLPTIRVRAAKPKPKSKPVQVAQPALATSPAPAVLDTQDARTGTVGVYANSTSVATKVNTPLVNIPQSVNVATKEYIKDQGFQSVTDITRYVPGVDVHQGEGNRDELVIRGVDSSANFFVNGFRDDVQIFRDLYNAQSVEVLKGPSALTFGRGSGGGLVNRTLKEADWSNVKEVTGQTGSYFDRRATIDLDQAINQQLAVRLNAMYEKATPSASTAGSIAMGSIRR
jgi:catecholate siderophore receptor